MRGRDRQMWTLSNLGKTETNSMQERQAACRSSTQEIVRLLCNPKVNYHVEDFIVTATALERDLSDYRQTN
jgi:hypothetical protein